MAGMQTHEPSRTHEKPHTAPALLDFGSVCDRVGRERGRPARLAFWRGAKSGTFPAPVKAHPGGSRIFWRRDEIERWIADRPRAIYAKARDANAERLDPPEPEAPPTIDGPIPAGARRVTVTRAPRACPDCGGAVAIVAPSVYSCTDSDGLGCAFVCVVEGNDDAA